MKWIKKVRPRVEGIMTSIGRFPLTTLFLFGIAGLDVWMIEQETIHLEAWVAALVIGAFLSALAQMVHERFFPSQAMRYGLYGITILITIVYYYLARSYGVTYLPLSIRSGILIGTIFIAFLWVPSIKTPIHFHETFLAGLKALFFANLYSIVVAIGTSLLLSAISGLLVEVPFNVYLHVLNFNFVLLAPLFFLSYIPNYPGETEAHQEEEVRATHAKEVYRAIIAPKSLEVLLTYIVVPLLLLYTLVLLLYFILNIRQNFWSDPILEPLLMSYALVGIFIYLLIWNIKNKISEIFKRVFPKIIVVVMAFQLYASFRRMEEIGLTHGRYFVLLTVAATLLTGLLFSFEKRRKSGLVAIIALTTSLIAMTPPLDGFTIGRRYHRQLVEETLQQNNLIQNGKIVSNENLPDQEKENISRGVSYLESVGGLEEVAGIETSRLRAREFEELFGFSKEFSDDTVPTTETEYATLESELALDVSDYDFLFQLSDYAGGSNRLSGEDRLFETNTEEYQLRTRIGNDGESYLELFGQENQLLVSVDLTETYEEVLDRSDSARGTLTLEEATVDVTNEQANMRLVFQSINVYNDEYSADLYLLIDIN